MKTQANTKSEPNIGEGIFLIKDVANILRLPQHKVRRWLNEFWDKKFTTFEHSFGDNSRAVNFYTLIEFHIFYRLRENGYSAQQIQTAYQTIASDLKTKYPFAQDILHIDGKHIWYEYLGGIMKVDKKRKLYLKGILEPFLYKIDYSEDNIAERYYPLGKEKAVIVDPRHQLGQPTVLGTNIKTQSIYNLHMGGESNDDICMLYNLSLEMVEDAILFHRNAA